VTKRIRALVGLATLAAGAGVAVATLASASPASADYGDQQSHPEATPTPSWFVCNPGDIGPFGGLCWPHSECEDPMFVQTIFGGDKDACEKDPYGPCAHPDYQDQNHDEDKACSTPAPSAVPPAPTSSTTFSTNSSTTSSTSTASTTSQAALSASAKSTPTVPDTGVDTWVWAGVLLLAFGLILIGIVRLA